MSKNIVQKVVVAAVIKADDGVLLLQRSKNETTFPGLWELPSGKKEPLEDVETALHREIEEEAGIKGEIIRPLSVFNYTVEKDTEVRDSTQINYLVKPITQEIVLSSEHDQCAWVSFGDLDSYEMSKETRSVVEKAFI